MSKSDPDMSNAPETGEQQPPHIIPITGRFDQYRSSFWAAILAVAGLRYLPREGFFRQVWNKDHNPAFASKHAYSAVVGGIMESVTGFFAYRTYKDMKSIFSQVLAWEFDKKKEDVNFSDFRNSRNSVVQQTLSNYMTYNVRRMGINTLFFLPLLAGPIIKKAKISSANSKWGKYFHPDSWSPQLGEGLGLGALAAYLFSDVVSRKGTPFEALQTMIDLKINHAGNVADKISSTDLLDIYERHAAEGKIQSFLPLRGTPEWDRAMAIFDRMADLMNQTYKNTRATEYADLGIDDYIFMMGNNLIQPAKPGQTLAFIEVANRYDVPALKEVAQSMKAGKSLAEALQKYPVTQANDKAAEPSAEKRFTDTIGPRAGFDATDASLAEQVKRQKLATEPQLGQSA